jgi:hypothetical protein
LPREHADPQLRAGSDDAPRLAFPFCPRWNSSAVRVPAFHPNEIAGFTTPIRAGSRKLRRRGAQDVQEAAR